MHVSIYVSDRAASECLVAHVICPGNTSLIDDGRYVDMLVKCSGIFAIRKDVAKYQGLTKCDFLRLNHPVHILIVFCVNPYGKRRI